MGAIHPLDSKKIPENDIMTARSEEIRAKFGGGKKLFLHRRQEPEPTRAAAPMGCTDTAIGTATLSAAQSRSHRPGSETKAGLKLTPQLPAGP